MSVRGWHAAGLALLVLAAPAAAQDPASEPVAPPAAEAVPVKPKPKPASPKPKPVPAGDVSKDTSEAPAKTEAGEGAPGADLGLRGTARPEKPARRNGRRAPTAASKLELRKEGETAATPFAPPAEALPQTQPQSEPPSQSPPPPQGAAAAPVVACEPGQSVLYDGPNGFAFWVTRSGAVTINNPLRPLTPDVTRVLQLVIAGKLATAYGPDLAVLRRGGAPGALEGLLGGPIRWDATLGTLPDGLEIVTDSGAPLAQMRFKECGTAPAAAAPVARADQKSKGRKTGSMKPAPGADPAGAPTPAKPGSATGGAAAGSAASSGPARRLNLPQGAIPD